MANKILQVATKWLNQVSLRPTTDPFTQPLLDKNAILNLYYRALHVLTTEGATIDLAHRLPGDTRSVFRGGGLDFEESRPYQWGDELRFMNWRLMARTAEPFMKVFSEERRRSVFILIDQRGSMNFGTRERLKVTQAVRVAAIIAFAAQHLNFEISGVILGNQATWMEACNDEQSVFHFINVASQARNPHFSANSTITLGYIIRLLHTMLSSGSQLLIVSDFYDLDEQSTIPLLQLRKDHDIQAVHIIDPAELELPRAGKLCMQAQSKMHTVNCMDHSVLQQYKQAAFQFVETRTHLLRANGIKYTRIRTDLDDIEDHVFENSVSR